MQLDGETADLGEDDSSDFGSGSSQIMDNSLLPDESTITGVPEILKRIRWMGMRVKRLPLDKREVLDVSVD